MSDSVDEIPILDIKGLTEKEEDLQHLAAQIKDAFTNIGFIGIKNHNISAEVVCAFLNVVLYYYQLPILVKNLGYSECCYHRLWLIARVSPWKRRLLTQKQRVWLYGTVYTIELSGKTLHSPNTPHAKLVKILNVSHWIFEQLLYQNEPHLF